MNLCNLQFSCADFLNIVVGGILTGIVSAAFYTILANWISRRSFKKSYGQLRTASANDRDWECFEMADNVFCNRIPINSKARIIVSKQKIGINILQWDNREWNGVLTILGPNWGKLNFTYINELEVGFKDCFIGYFGENGKYYNYIYLMPNEMGYGKELLVREIVPKE
jgi:hypothetical protein